MGHRQVGVGSPDLKVQGLYCSGACEYSEYSEYSRARVSRTHSAIEAGNNWPECQGTVGSKVPVRQMLLRMTFSLLQVRLLSAASALTVSTEQLIKF